MKIGLIGADSGASNARAMHMAESAAQGFPLEYNLSDISPMGRSALELQQILQEIEQRGYAGVNITHPCKQSALGQLDWLPPAASVNTVVFIEVKRFDRACHP